MAEALNAVGLRNEWIRPVVPRMDIRGYDEKWNLADYDYDTGG